MEAQIAISKMLILVMVLGLIVFSGFEIYLEHKENMYRLKNKIEDENE
jgi:cell division protein FtsL